MTLSITKLDRILKLLSFNPSLTEGRLVPRPEETLPGSYSFHSPCGSWEAEAGGGLGPGLPEYPAPLGNPNYPVTSFIVLRQSPPFLLPPLSLFSLKPESLSLVLPSLWFYPTPWPHPPYHSSSHSPTTLMERTPFRYLMNCYSAFNT